MADFAPRHPAQASEEPEQEIRAWSLKKGDPFFSGDLQLGIMPLTPGSVPLAHRNDAIYKGYAVMHPDTKEVQTFGTTGYTAAYELAKSWGTKMRTLYTLGGE